MKIKMVLLTLSLMSTQVHAAEICGSVESLKVIGSVSDTIVSDSALVTIKTSNGDLIKSRLFGYSVATIFSTAKINNKTVCIDQNNNTVELK